MPVQKGPMAIASTASCVPHPDREAQWTSDIKPRKCIVLALQDPSERLPMKKGGVANIKKCPSCKNNMWQSLGQLPHYQPPKRSNSLASTVQEGASRLLTTKAHVLQGLRLAGIPGQQVADASRTQSIKACLPKQSRVVCMHHCGMRSQLIGRTSPWSRRTSLRSRARRTAQTILTLTYILIRQVSGRSRWHEQSRHGQRMSHVTFARMQMHRHREEQRNTILIFKVVKGPHLPGHAGYVQLPRSER